MQPCIAEYGSHGFGLPAAGGTSASGSGSSGGSGFRIGSSAFFITVVGGVIPDDDVIALKKLGVSEILLQDTPPKQIVEMLTQLVAERGPR